MYINIMPIKRFKFDIRNQRFIDIGSLQSGVSKRLKELKEDEWYEIMKNNQSEGILIRRETWLALLEEVDRHRKFRASLRSSQGDLEVSLVDKNN